MSGDEFYDDETTSGPIDAEYEARYAATGFDPRGYFGPQPCTKAGHVHGCPGMAGGDHELMPGWIAYEEDGNLVEVEVA